jgi:hypothetical protein
MRETLALEMPISTAMMGAALTASAVAREIWLGDEWGFQERRANHPPIP